MRIIAGSRKSIKLRTIEGINTRPTLDRTKETLFNIINPEITGSMFLDLFSGSGSIGLEALSRGAAFTVFVENNRHAVRCIRDNIKTTGFELNTRLMDMDIFQSISILEAEHKKVLDNNLYYIDSKSTTNYQAVPKVFDIIFMDPPFNKLLEKEVLKRLNNSSLLNKDTLIIIEASGKTDFSYLTDLDFVITREKSYKTHKHVFIKKGVVG